MSPYDLLQTLENKLKITSLSEIEFTVLFRSVAREEEVMHRSDILNAIEMAKESDQDSSDNEKQKKDKRK